MGKTEDNLQAAFAGESQANRRYLFFAARADKDGFPGAARLFRAAAEAETVHARNHLRVLGEVKTTAENLETAISGENHEFTEMYPAFISQAQADTNNKAENSFELANAVEKIHHGLFQASLKALDATGREGGAPYFVCQVCGNTILGETPNKCPVCGAPRSQFKQVD